MPAEEAAVCKCQHAHQREEMWESEIAYGELWIPAAAGIATGTLIT